MTLNRLFSNLLRDESGQDLIEYALVAALIGLGATAWMKTFATTIGTALTGIGSQINQCCLTQPAKLGFGPIWTLHECRSKLNC